MFLKRNDKTIKKEKCTRCSILRLYFSAILLLIVIYFVVGENISILSFVNKNTGVYVVFSLGTLVVLYRVIEWHFFIRGSKKFDKMN